MKNWLPAESGSLERAMERTPRSWLRPLNSAFFLERSNSVNAGLRRAQCRHDRNLLRNGGVANGHFIFARNFSARTINDKTDVAVFHPVEHVGTTFADLEHPGHRHPCRFERGC